MKGITNDPMSDLWNELMNVVNGKYGCGWTAFDGIRWSMNEVN